PPSDQFDIAAPIADAPPRGRRVRPLGRAVAHRVGERAKPKCRETELPAVFERVMGTIHVRLDHGVAQFVTEVGRIETLEESEPPLRHVEHARLRHLTSSGSRPPARAAWTSPPIRRASARATRMPVLVMR